MVGVGWGLGGGWVGVGWGLGGGWEVRLFIIISNLYVINIIACFRLVDGLLGLTHPARVRWCPVDLTSLYILIFKQYHGWGLGGGWVGVWYCKLSLFGPLGPSLALFGPLWAP